MLPAVSITIPTYNEEKNIRACLNNLASQDYPRNKMEVLVIDGGSTDKTVALAKQFPFVRVLANPARNTHVGKMIGLRQAKGELWAYFDADLQANGRDWLKSVVRPLQEDKSLVAAASPYYGRPGDSWVERYINLDPIGRDTLFAWFTPSIESTIVERKRGYAVCLFRPDHIPPQGCCLFRRQPLMKVLGQRERFRELDVLYLLTRAGYNRFAYVPWPGFYHRHPRSLAELRQKRMRNADRNYIPGSKENYVEYKWFNLSESRDFLKMIGLILYAFSVIGPTLGGIYKTIKHRDLSGMVEVVYVPVAVEAYLEAFLRHRDGREFIHGQLEKLLQRRGRG